MSMIEQWLQGAGLEQYIPAFMQAGLTQQQFIQITIQDYAQYGMTSLQDKQKLFRLITSLKSQGEQQASPSEPRDAPRVLQRQPPQQLQNPNYPNNVPPQQAPQQVQNYQQPQYQQPPQQPAYMQPQQPAQPSAPNTLQGRPNKYTANPTAHPNCPSQIDGRGIPTVNRTVIPTDQQFLDVINQKIRVVMRKRPVNNQEAQFGHKDIMSGDGWNQTSVHEPKVKVDLTKYIEVSTFRYDHVFSEQADNYEVYFYTAKPLINAIFQGKNATCFAYGQTGSGKTWTMMQRETGIYVLAVNDIFHMLQSDPNYSRLRLTVTVSFYEIYGNKLFDLLNNRKILRALEDGKGIVQIFGIYEQEITNIQELLNCIDSGLQSRSVGATGANADSSRSHAILQIQLKAPNKTTHGKISFIDLAGAERASDVQNTDRQTRMEGAEINKSLLALKECIRAMDKGSAHLPFRDSKLTLVLRDSFIKDSKTVMIACCSPTDKSCENTINTLRYASRVKDLMAAGNDRVKVPVIKPNQNVADLILGLTNNDAEVAQQQYQMQINQMKNQGPQNAFQNYGQAMVPQQQQYVPQPVEQPPMQQQYQQPNVYQNNIPEVYREPQRAPSGREDDEMTKTHCEIVEKIYEIEDDITRAHRKQVDQMMASVKEEVALLHQIENNEINIDNWVLKLEQILSSKENAISELRGQIGIFKQKLKEEAELSQSWKKHMK
ncbi:Kinesin-like_protein [Hexamita inflata]|uniref:Kinesin-like protein n=1 Tax=Hexamita inflata TaxID=28002 RepID=A0AA86UMR1_9EUKA|nr:Kinesin-like protein [Hexamita inflata]